MKEIRDTYTRSHDRTCGGVEGAPAHSCYSCRGLSSLFRFSGKISSSHSNPIWADWRLACFQPRAAYTLISANMDKNTAHPAMITSEAYQSQLKDMQLVFRCAPLRR